MRPVTMVMIHVRYHDDVCDVYARACDVRVTRLRSHGARALQHLHEERVYGCVADQLEEEQMLHTLESDRT